MERTATALSVAIPAVALAEMVPVHPAADASALACAGTLVEAEMVPP